MKKVPKVINTQIYEDKTENPERKIKYEERFYKCEEEKDIFEDCKENERDKKKTQGVSWKIVEDNKNKIDQNREEDSKQSRYILKKERDNKRNEGNPKDGRQKQEHTKEKDENAVIDRGKKNNNIEQCKIKYEKAKTYSKRIEKYQQQLKEIKENKKDKKKLKTW